MQHQLSVLQPSRFNSVCTKTNSREKRKRPCGQARAPKFIQERTYAVAAAAAFFAAFAAFAAVEALRRLFVFGGVAGASPINFAVMMLVTNSFGPRSSKSTAVRS